jgi:hypothetical protein
MPFTTSHGGGLERAFALSQRRRDPRFQSLTQELRDVQP